jgi:Leucine-rich repeat (LRR) protein
VASVFLVSGDGCPTSCECDTAGTSGVLAKCSAFDDTQHFGLDIAYLDLSNIPASPGLQLTDRIFVKAGLKRVSSITVVNSTLKVIDINAFHGLYNLNQLNLSGNHLGLLEPDMFANNTHLEKLSLSKNPLQYMQVDTSPYKAYFLNIPSLQELDLSGCSLSHLLPTMFNKLTTVTYVNLASNNISDVPKATFAPLLEMDYLDLSSNQLSQLRSDMFENNLEMTVLNMRNNLLSSLKGVKIQSLQTLDLGLCKFGSIDADTFIGFPDIRNLNLDGNSITSIHSDAFKRLTKLQNLDLSNNKLTGPLSDNIFISNIQLEILKLANNPEMKKFPETGFQGELSEMYLLDASKCGLTHLDEDDLKRMNRIERLYLHENDIQYIRPGVLSPKIVYLDLSGNKIAHLEQVSFPSGSSLRTLKLSGNPIKKMSPAYFVNTTRLTRLNLKSCELKQLWDSNDSALHSLKVLSYLNLANNKIKNLSLKDLKYIEYVQTLVLSGNPLACDDDLKELVKLLTENGVASSDGTEKKHSEEMNIKGSVDILPIKYDLGWENFMNHICEKKQNIAINASKPNESSKTITDAEPNPDEFSKPVIKLVPNSHEYSKAATGPGQVSDESSKTVIEFETTSDESIKTVINLQLPTDNTEIVTDNEDIFFTSMPDSKQVRYGFPEDIHKAPVIHKETNDIWLIIIVSAGALALIVVSAVLAVAYLKWKRQRNGYRNNIARRHSISRTPRPRRNSTVYQQLHEDPNTPTTPVMMSKVVERLSEQQMFSFPDRETSAASTTAAQPLNKVSYLSSPFHHSNIVPESV